MRAYADTNFLARLYLKQLEVDAAIEQAAEVWKGDVEPLPVTWLLEVELTGALELYVSCAHQGQLPRVTPEQAAVAHEDFQSDVRGGLLYVPADIGQRSLVSQTHALIRRHTAKHGNRTYDIMHVGWALELGCEAFWTFDRRAALLAEREGLKVPARLKSVMKQ